MSTTLPEVRSDSGDSEQVLVLLRVIQDQLDRLEEHESTAPHNTTATQHELSPES